MSYQIMVVKGPGDPRYFVANTTEQKQAAALQLVKERAEDGYYDDILEAELPDESNLLTDEQIEALPSESLKRVARAQRQVHKDRVKKYKSILPKKKKLEAALKGDAVAAWEFFNTRTGNEYEGYYFASVEDPGL